MRRVVATKPLRGGYSDGVDTIAHRKKARPAHLTAPRATLERLTSLLKRTGFRKRYAPHSPRRGKAEYGSLSDEQNLRHS